MTIVNTCQKHHFFLVRSYRHSYASRETKSDSSTLSLWILAFFGSIASDGKEACCHALTAFKSLDLEQLQRYPSSIKRFLQMAPKKCLRAAKHFSSELRFYYFVHRPCGQQTRRKAKASGSSYDRLLFFDAVRVVFR